jgi:restriction system protein
MSSVKMVTYDQLMSPLIMSLIKLGGSGSIDEIYETVIEAEKFDEEVVSVLHNPEKSSQTEIGYLVVFGRLLIKPKMLLK